MAQSKVNLPPVGTGDTGPIPVAVKKASTGEAVQQVELTTTVEGGAITPIAAGNPLAVVQTGTPALPTGASTETTLAAVNTKLGSALPLPTGAAADSSVQSVLTGVGAPADTAWVSGSGSIIAVLKGIFGKLAGTLTVGGTVTTSPPSNASTNVTQWAGTAAQTGHGLAANALRVELPTDGTGVVGITGTVPLPTGAATAAKQPALGTAGTPATDVITVQGSASGTPIPVSGTFSASGTTDLTASGSLTANGQTVAITAMNGMSVVNIDVSGTWAMNIGVQIRIDGTNWVSINGGRVVTDNTSGAITNGSISSNGRFQFPVSGCDGVRVLSAGFSSGTAVVALRASAAVGSVELGAALPNGTNIIGKVAIDQSNPTVTNAVYLTAGANLVGSVSIDQTTPGTTNKVDTELPAAAALTDADPSGPVAPYTGAAMMVHDGNAGVFKRAKAIFNTMNNTASGVIAAAPVGQFDDVSPTAVSENNFGPVRMSANRNQYQTIRDAAGNERGANVSSGNALLVDATATTQPVSLATLGHGTAAAAVRVELPTDGTGIVGLAAGTALIGKAGIDQTTPGTTNLVATEMSTGLTTFCNTALSNTKTAVKAGAGKVYGWMIHNPSAATTFIQVWNVAIGSITVGTTAPTYVIAIPAGASANVFGERGVTHSTEINIAATTTATGSTAPATAAVATVFYI